MTTSVNTTKVYDEIIDFIAARTTPESVIDFKLSHAAHERLLVVRASALNLGYER
jgi:hypothetical protein